jgi:hypothetical protein
VFDFGHVAGYAQIGPRVSSVSATIVVPRVSSSAITAIASTWVGAEAVGPEGQGEPFIQAGIAEIAGEPARRAHISPTYTAFWADSETGDHPWPLFSAHARDKVSVSLKHFGHQWSVSIIDGHKHRQIVTGDAGGANLEQAMWSQEDTGRSIPYPTVTGVQLSNLSINGAAPTKRNLDPQWMSVGKILFEPTRLADRGFAVQRREGLAVGPELSALLSFEHGSNKLYDLGHKLAEASASTPRTKRAEWATQLTIELMTFAGSLRRANWPRNAHASVTTLLNAIQHELSLTRGLAHLPTWRLSEAEARWSASVTTSLIAAARVLRYLRLPV